MESNVYSVSEINLHIKELLDSDRLLSSLFVRGELSNYKIYPSGHHYFTLKDAEGTLRCVMFRSSASKLRFRPENGMKVIVCGRITVFPRDGQYQLYAVSLTPDGVGDLHVAFEQLKEKLLKEGLFDAGHKKPIPRYPQRIAVVTSPAGAAVRDMLRILRARYPICGVVILGVRVQGEEAPAEIAGAIRYANRWKVADLIITGRGGGSIEDLWAFNDERVARAIYASDIPVISAVGHEPDVTISDFVADLRAATPSNAAELAVPDREELFQTLDGLQARILRSVQHRLASSAERLGALAKNRGLQNPLNYIEDKKKLVAVTGARLLSAAKLRAAASRERYARLAASLDAMSPLKVLGRGYSIVKAADGRLIKEASRLAPGDGIEVRLYRGALRCTVDAVKEDDLNEGVAAYDSEENEL